MENNNKYQITIHGVDCIECAKEIEKGVEQLGGINSAYFNFTSGILTVEGITPKTSIDHRIKELGFTIGEPSVALPTKPILYSLKGFLDYLFTQKETRLGLIGSFCLLISLVLKTGGISAPIIFAIQLMGLLIAGYPLAKSGISNLLINHEFNINLLMSVAAIGAILLGDLEEGVSLILLFVLAMALEGYTTEHARGVLGELSQLVPNLALRINQGHEEWVPLDQLSLGDMLLIKPGERIPMDGKITRGSSDVNQAPITGESTPVVKEIGSQVFAGSVNGSGLLEMQVTSSVSDNTLARIIEMITQSQQVRSKRERTIDRFAKVYTPFSFGAAILVAAIPPLFFGQPFFNYADGSHGWFYRALALLVIACPCALVLSTPVAALSGIIRASRQGVLFKGGSYLEGFAQIKAIAFDKTGTLTQGQPSVVLSRSVNCNGDDRCADCDDMLAMAGSLESRSTHPLAMAVVNEAQARGLMRQYPAAEEVMVSAGQGIYGKINGEGVTIANHKHFDEHFSHSQEICSAVSQAEANGYTTMMVSHESQVSGFITLIDQPRQESVEVITELQKMGRQTIMLTGDNKNTAQSIADRLGIKNVHSNLMPEDKVNILQEIKKQFGPVAMVGDGINDAPAMAAADIGIAIGGSTSAQALETADVILMAPSLKQLPFSILLSQYTQKIIQMNLVFSLGVKGLFIILALLGAAPLWLAVIADSGMAVMVVLNSLRPLHFNTTPI